ncbi:MAG: FecR family protein [Blastocatellia bacterium]
MFAELRKRLSRVSPRVAIAVGLLIAFAAGSGVALLLMRGGETVDADDAVQPMAARIDRVDGNVGIARVIDENTEPDWDDATINTPVSVGDRIYTRDNSRASVALTGHNFVRLDPNASLDVLALDDQRTQLALRSGSAIFDVGALEPNAFYEVATPCGAVDFTQPGLYQVGIDDNTAIISVLSGLAQVVGASGSGYINKGEVYTLVGAAASEAIASTLAPTLAGGIVDDYYRYRYPSTYDGRYQSYDTYVSDAFYYDPYRSSASYRYVSADIPGLYDLDYYGDWTNIDGYGHCWAPRVSSGWAPFRSGSWDLYDAWGPTWVSQEPWGWAPYHYGRWTFVQQRWFWVPVEVRTRRSYCPATVAFIPLAQDQIGWVPLAPGEVYVPRYYDASFRPRYLASREVVSEVTVQRTFVNLNAPSGVTVVPVQALKRRIEPNLIAQVDPQVIARSKPTADPFAVEGVRELAIKRKGEGRKQLARAEQQAFDRPVLTSRKLTSLPAETNLAKTLRVEPVSGEVKNKTLKIDRTGQVITARRPDGLPRAMAPNQVSNDKDRGQRGNAAAAQPTAAEQRVQQEQLRQQMREQLKTERQQQSGAAAQAEAARRAQQQQMRQQQEQQKRLERKPPEASVQRQQQRTGQQKQMQEQSRVRAQQEAVRQEAARKAQQPRQQTQNQQRKPEKRPPQRKPPEASVRQQQPRDRGLQITEQARIRRAQQESGRQQGQARQQQRAIIEQRKSQASIQRAQQEAARQQGQARQQQQRAMIEQRNRMASRLVRP